MATGISVKGRQLLQVMPAGSLFLYVNVEPSTLQTRYLGFVAIELVSPLTGVRYQAAGRSLWYQGVVVQLPINFGLEAEAVCYWRVSGIPWESAV